MFTTAALTLALVASGSAAVAVAHKSVTLDVDGVVTKVSTFGSSVADVLAAKHVKVGPHDMLSLPEQARLADGMVVMVRTAREVEISLNGKTATVWTTAATAQAMLEMYLPQGKHVALIATPAGDNYKLGINLTAGDPISVTADGKKFELEGPANDVAAALRKVNVSPRPGDRVSVELGDKGVIIKVQRVVVATVASTQEVPFEQVSQDSPELTVGTKKVVQQGKVGEREVVETVTTVDGVEESRVVTASKVTRDPVSQITQVGTKPAAPAVPDVPAPSPGSAQAIAQQMMSAQYSWGNDQFACLVNLWNRESSWNTYAANPSGAYGIPQALPGSKMAAFGSDWKTNPATQIAWGLSYISGRYGDPCGAWSSFLSKGWY